MRLTPTQMDFLYRAMVQSLKDGSGNGAVPHDGFEIRTAESLFRKGLVARPAVWGPISGAKITDAGRAALKS